MSTTRYRRADALRLDRGGDRYRLTLPPTSFCVDVDLTTVELLSHLGDWRTLDQVAACFPDHDGDSIGESLHQLLELGLLSDGSPSAAEHAFKAWQHWGAAALAFHHATSDAPFVSPADEARAVRPSMTGDLPPPAFKRYPMAPRMYMPRALLAMDASYPEVLQRRRTTRRFAPEPLSLQTLSTLLHHVFAPLHFVDTGPYGAATMRAHASGGGRHEEECYVGVRNVDGVSAGLYHYDVLEHALEQLREGYDPLRVATLCCDQDWIADAPVVLWVTARFERMMWKYRHARAYRVLHMNLGCLMQSFSTTATALGLAPFVTAALRDSELNQYLGVDGVEEAGLALLAAGHASESATSLPWPSRPLGLVQRGLVLEADLPAPFAPETSR